MEEQQIQNFVHRVAQDKALREELEMHPEDVISRENFTPLVAQVILKLVPVMNVANIHNVVSFTWWS